tara:strand:- start:100 stop:264 length:165 start_codon:yes stop_codon:yes gene_type:complete
MHLRLQFPKSCSFVINLLTIHQTLHHEQRQVYECAVSAAIDEVVAEEHVSAEEE